MLKIVSKSVSEIVKKCVKTMSNNWEWKCLKTVSKCWESMCI